MRWRTYVAPLLEHVSDLEPDVHVCERARWVWQDVVGALETVRVFVLLWLGRTPKEEPAG